MLHAVIMAGGVGTRFWPQSRRQLPKQFLRLKGERTLIQQAVDRCLPSIDSERVWIVTGAPYVEETARQLPNVAASHVLVEPCGRNTAPCIGLAAIQILAEDPDGVMIVTPADHVIDPTEQFGNAISAAVDVIEQTPDALVLFGVTPTYPSTGFGYIHRGQQISAHPVPSYRVSAFREKPDVDTAVQYIATNEYYWNCGIFVWRAQTILDALQKFSPEIYERLQQLRPAIGTAGWQKLLETEFPRFPSISIDYAVLEKAAGSVYVVEAPFNWDDIGSWHALTRHLPADASGNVKDGLACVIESEGCIVRSDDKHLIAAIGARDLIIVHTDTATLVADKSDEGALKRLLSVIEKENLSEYL